MTGSRVCTRCGTPAPSGNEFCGKCGASIGSTPVAPPALTMKLTRLQCRILMVALLGVCGFSAPLGLPWYVTVGSFLLAAVFVGGADL